MEFDSQIRKFLQLTYALPISANAQCLYIQLLHAFRMHLFPDELKIDNMTLHNTTRLSRHQLIDARVELQKISLLCYTPGSGSASGTYKLIDLSNAKIDAIIQISKNNGDEIADLAGLKEQVDKLQGDYKIWGNFVLQTLNKAIKRNSKGVFNNYYVTTQKFLQAQNALQYDTIFKLIQHLKFREDISNKEAYVLATVANSIN